MKIRDAAQVMEIAPTIEAQDQDWGGMELRRVGDTSWVTSSHNVETSSCYACGHAVLVAYDEDGTPRLTEPIEGPIAGDWLDDTSIETARDRSESPF